MDNRLFNINGKTKNQLTLAIKTLLLNEYDDQEKVKGWYFRKDKGLILTWYVGSDYKATPFTNRMGKPCPIEEKELVELLWNWLSSQEAKSVEFAAWEVNADHDGSNDLGWRLYVEDWGRITDGHSIDHYAIAAFKPVYLWYGK